MSKENSVKEKIQIVIDFPKGVTGIVNREDHRKNRAVPFRGIDRIGEKYRIFAPDTKELIYDEILERYKRINKDLSEYEVRELQDRIAENIHDVSIYKALVEYDNYNMSVIDHESKSKVKAYLDAMLKPILRKSGESLEHFKRREGRERNFELKKAGISVIYELGNKVFNRNILDVFNVLKNAKRSEYYADIMISGKNFTKKVNYKPNNIHDNVKMELYKPFANKSISKPKSNKKDENFGKKFKKLIAPIFVATGVLFAGISLSSTNDEKDNELDTNAYTYTQNTEANVKEKMPSETEKVTEQAIKNDNILTEENDNTVTVDEKYNQNKEEVKHNQNEENVEKIEENTSEIKDSNKQVTMKDLLMATLDIGFDTEFKIDSGKFYEAPNGTGKTGKYDNIDSNVKVNMVDAVKEGKFVTYRKSSDMSFSEIYSEVDKVLSVHTEKADGAILGWNIEPEKIEKAMINSELSKIKENLSPEEIEYFDNIDMNAKVNIDDKEVIKHLSKAKQAQNSMKQQKRSNKVNDQIR